MLLKERSSTAHYNCTKSALDDASQNGLELAARLPHLSRSSVRLFGQGFALCFKRADSHPDRGREFLHLPRSGSAGVHVAAPDGLKGRRVEQCVTTTDHCVGVGDGVARGRRQPVSQGVLDLKVAGFGQPY